MKLIETFVESKSGDPSSCEDLIVENDRFVAVFDGATDKTDARYAGMTGGRFAVEALSRTLDLVAGDISAADCIEAMTDDLRREIAEHGPTPAPEDNPSASAVIYSLARSEVWRVGDCSWAGAGEAHRGGKQIDQVVAGARAAMLHALIDAGETVEELLATDPGRAMVLPLLEQQHRFRNAESAPSGLGFGALDGTPVPSAFLEITPVSAGDEIVFTTDGYPQILPTLAQAEEYLAQDLATDPLRIGRHKSTKGVRPGKKSFDDRAYARFLA